MSKKKRRVHAPGKGGILCRGAMEARNNLSVEVLEAGLDQVQNAEFALQSKPWPRNKAELDREPVGPAPEARWPVALLTPSAWAKETWS